MSDLINIAILGASGFVGGELINLCSKHQHINIKALSANSLAFNNIPEPLCAGLVNITRAPRYRINFLRSIEKDSDITHTKGYPLDAQTAAKPIPVLPEEHSTTVCPGDNCPFCSAHSITPRARRSLTDPAGLNASSLANTCTSGRFSRCGDVICTNGVDPIVDNMFLWRRDGRMFFVNFFTEKKLEMFYIQLSRHRAHYTTVIS